MVAIIHVNRTQSFQGRVIDIASTIGRFPNKEAAKIYYEFFKDDISKIDSHTMNLNVAVIEGETMTKLASGFAKRDVIFEYSISKESEDKKNGI